MTFVYRIFLVVLAPFLVMGALETWVLPPNQFTFRAWEAIKVNLLYQALPGPFYPNQSQIFFESGDQDQKNKNRKNLWITDSYGQRNREIPNSGDNYGVIVGDSNIAGCSLDQSDLLSEELKKKTGFLWVNLNYEYVVPWLHPLCRERRPKWLIFELKRGSFLNLQNLGGPVQDPVSSQFYFIASKVDHLTKITWLNKLRAATGSPPCRIETQLQVPHLQIPLQWLQRILAKGVSQRKEADIATFTKMNSVGIIKSHNDRCRALGIDFILVVLPDRVREADPLLEEVKKSGIKIVDFMPTEEYPHGVDLEKYWQKGDSHWTKQGTQMTADKILPILKK